MKDMPSTVQMGPQQAVVGVGTSKSDVGSGKSMHAIRSSSIIDMLQLFPTSSEHDALDAHTTNFHSTAISRFPIMSIKIWAIFGLFRLTFSKLIFCIPAGWPNFFSASLKVVITNIIFRLY